MKRKFPLVPVMCLAVAHLLVGCIMAGDKIINATDFNLKIIVHSVEGGKLKRTIPPHTIAGERRKALHDRGIEYAKVAVLYENGQRLGEYARNPTNNRSGKNGEFLTLLITTNGVFSVPKKYWADPLNHIVEIELAGR